MKLVPVWYPHDAAELEKVEAVLAHVDAPWELQRDASGTGQLTLLVAEHAAEPVHRLLVAALTEGEVGDEEDAGGSGLILPPGF